ncbi:2-polyprenyl-6-methoxyphenol hydroxylase [Sinomicrobium oceani]|uniref:2-polyprenyl-6-methoxyphenol hydroxylase n=1 Tax=Sinomicrobium oceani TaxID=1150368 RepID=A0A1K1RR49_9FLAO|nr:NAD(P)/FAD-dependent oxidoreductase [Sinomicrobium oceani]SFW74215.1 2-polyprenyl-6-methoxyphenol hydroxylase [Sinomicrobium oceani]
MIQNNKEDQVIIVGAGIAGLSLAIQLTEKKIPCIVLEARESFGGATSGVRISAKGVRILEKMGISNIGEPTEKLIMYFGKNQIKFDIQNDKGTSPAIIVTRLAVFEKLRERTNELGIKVIYNFKLENAIENTDGVVAVSTDGERIQGKYLVGADGVGSKVRSLLNPDSNSNKRYAGYLGLGFIFPSDEKVEMSLFNNINGFIGLGSVGTINSNDTHKNNFLWTHIHMTEAEAKSMTDSDVYKQITERAKNWTPYLQEVFQQIKANPKTVLYHLPVYNGSVPDKWYSQRLFLIGDAAHPYGPGGQGISLGMLDAEALCQLFTNEITEEKKANFQTTRAAIAKAKGESSEERNKPENQIVTEEELLSHYQFMKDFHQKSNGKLAM